MKIFKKIMLAMLVAGCSSSVAFGAAVADPENTIITSRVLCCDEASFVELGNGACNYIFTSVSDTTATVLDLDGNCLVTLRGHEGPVYLASFNNAGDRIVTASYDGTAKVWDLAGNCLATLSGHEDVVISASFNADGDRIVTASLDNTAKVWDLDGNCLATLRGHEGPVYSASFNAAGDCIVTASYDGTAKVWDLAGTCLVTLRGHEGPVYSASFNAVGDCIVTASYDGTVRLWEDTRITQAKNGILQLLVAQDDRWGANSPAHIISQDMVKDIFDCYGLRPFDAIQ